MNHAELRAAEQRFFDEVLGERPAFWSVDGRIVPTPYDLVELPEDSSWDDWAQSAADQIGPAVYRGHQLQITETARRRMLVDFARGIAALAHADNDYERSSDALANLPRVIALQRTQLASRNRAYAALSRLTSSGAKPFRRSAAFTLRCPENCFLGGVYLQVASETDTSGETQLLITETRKGHRHAAWLADDWQTMGSPMKLDAGCIHGKGRVLTVPIAGLGAGDNTQRCITDVQGSSWTPMS